MARWLPTARLKSLLRFRLRTLLGMIAFVAVLLGWWSDRQRLKQRIREHEALSAVLRAAEPAPFDDLAGLVVHEDFVRRQVYKPRLIPLDSAAQLLDLVSNQHDIDLRTLQRVPFEVPDESKSEAVEGLLLLLRDPDPEVRIRTCAVLDKIADPTAIAPALLSAIEDDSNEVQREAIRMLRTALKGYKSDAESAEVTASLLDMIGGDKPRVRLAAALAIRDARPTKEMLTRLIRAFESESDEKVRGAIARSVEALHRG